MAGILRASRHGRYRLLRPIHPLMVAAFACVHAPAHAANPWALCPAQPPLATVDVAAPESPGQTRAEADRARSEGGHTLLEGRVGIRRGRQTVGGDRVELDRVRQHAAATGDAFFATDDYQVRGAHGEIQLDSGAFSIEDARYRQPQAHAQGRADRITRDADMVTRLESATWSTCPTDAEAWHLAGSSVTLDPASRQGTARNVTVWFKGVPLLYSPWFRFPLGEERMSGFLAPRIGQSSQSGAEFSVPWYWNAAPDFDATLTPRWLEKRGTQLQSEWRWLSPVGSWQFDNEYLPNDDLAGEDRVLNRLQQHAGFGNWRTRIDATEVSDRDYFDDLGSDLAVTSQTHLRRHADLDWYGAPGHFRARVQDYQTLDETIAPVNRPYEQLPQLTFTSDGTLGGLDTRLDTEFVRFERDASDTADRLRLVPAATWPVEAPGWFLRPRLAIDHTSYRVDRVTSTGPEAIDRTLPIASLDAGLIFDRLGKDYQQTLEPRAFYVYVPEEQQDSIPVFDSGRYGFSFSQLFRERRFTGGDRIGDTNQLTLALTSRLLERDGGREVLRGSIGAIRYFEERTVTLPSGAPPDPNTDDTSDVVAEVAASPTRAWSGDVSLQWDPDTELTDRRQAAVRYRGTGGGIANFGYRFRRDEQEQVDLSFAWPIGPRWQMVAGSKYSLRDERDIESILGLEYESCCWRFRTVAHEYLNEDDNAASGTSPSQAIYFELTLKGLGPIGEPAGERLERAILGYHDPAE